MWLLAFSPRGLETAGCGGDPGVEGAVSRRGAGTLCSHPAPSLSLPTAPTSTANLSVHQADTTSETSSAHCPLARLFHIPLKVSTLL